MLPQSFTLFHISFIIVRPDQHSAATHVVILDKSGHDIKMKYKEKEILRQGATRISSFIFYNCGPDDR
jgi:hypothetical protein